MTYLKRPIDDVNVLRYVDVQQGQGNVQCWLQSRIDPMHGPDFATVSEVLDFIKENLSEAPMWTVYFGALRTKNMGTLIPEVTLACRKPARIGAHDRIGKRVAKGSIEEVWPVFESYVRML